MCAHVQNDLQGRGKSQPLYHGYRTGLSFPAQRQQPSRSVATVWTRARLAVPLLAIEYYRQSIMDNPAFPSEGRKLRDDNHLAGGPPAKLSRVNMLYDTVLRERLKIPPLTARMSGAVVDLVCSDQLSRGLRAWQARSRHATGERIGDCDPMRSTSALCAR